ncbi:MAG TPA: hypothetical protein VFB73_02205 [Chloroflexota bacterium]|nr:hypothetical protein [Chloroflexota bacterium]
MLLPAAALLLSVGLALAAQGVASRLPDALERYCEEARASFERSNQLARDLAATLEGLDAEGPEATAAGLELVRERLARERALLQHLVPPAGAEEVQARGLAAVDVLLTLADPGLVRAARAVDREALGAYIREQFLAARAEARAAMAALRQTDTRCAKRVVQGAIRLLSRSR